MGARSESVPVRCPACRRERVHTVPSYPCACGAPVTPVPDRRGGAPAGGPPPGGAPGGTPPGAAGGRPRPGPQPELGCPCGTVLRIPVTGASGPTAREPGTATKPTSTPEAVSEPVTTPGAVSEPVTTPEAVSEPITTPEAVSEPITTPEAVSEPVTTPTPAPTSAASPPQTPGRRGVPSVAIRTALDAVTAAVLHLRRLGHGDVRRADQRPTSGIGLAARGLLAQVDPSRRPAALRDVECLWLTAMTEGADCVYFSLAGYTEEARAGADRLRVPLFVLDLTGTLHPVNPAADALDDEGPRDP